MAPTIITYFNYSEVTNTPPVTLNEFRNKLAQFSLFGVMYVCSVINSVLHSWQGKKDDAAHERLVRDSFAPPAADYIVQCCQNPGDPRSVFHRRQILFVCKQALLVCPESGLNAPSLPYWGGLGSIFLMANDVLRKSLSNAEDIKSQMVKVISDFIPVAEGSGFQQPINKILRSYLLLHEFFKGNGSIEIATIFERTIGMSFDTFQSLCVATFGKYASFDLARYEAKPLEFPLHESWYRRLTMPPEYVSPFLGEISGTAEEFKQNILQLDRGFNDFTALRDKPFFRSGELLLPIDVGFAAEKFETGPFWIVNSQLHAQQRVQFHALWGMAFERYASWLLKESSEASYNKLYPNPKFANGNEVCDAIMICNDSALFIEMKGSTFTARAKYGMEDNLLKSEIEEKLIGTPGGEKKGVAQLAHACATVFNRKKPQGVVGLDLSRIKKVFPVLITRDDIGGALVLNAYLSMRFKQIFDRKSVRGVIVTPLFALSSQDTESICGYLKEASFSDMLEERYRNDPDLLSTFWAVKNSVVERVGYRRPTVLADPLKGILAMVKRQLFPSGERSEADPLGHETE